MADVQEGDIGALGELYRRHHHRVRGLCLQLTTDPHLADDLVQETFLRVLRYRHTFAGRSQFSSWLYRIARNTVMAHLNKRVDWPVSAEVPAPAASAEDPRLANLAEALARLPDEHRDVLIWSRFEGLRYQEIARRCGASVAAIKVRVHRAVRRLRDEYLRLEREDHEVRNRS